MSSDEYEIKRFDNKVEPFAVPTFKANVVPPVEETPRSSNHSTPKHNLHDSIPPITRPLTAKTDGSGTYSYSTNDFESDAGSDTGLPPAAPAVYVSPSHASNSEDLQAQRPNEEYPLQPHVVTQETSDYQYEGSYPSDNSAIEHTDETNLTEQQQHQQYSQQQLQHQEQQHQEQQQQEQQQIQRVGPQSRIEETNEFENSEDNIGICGLLLYYLAFFIVIITFPVAAFFCVKVVQEYERAVIFRLGTVLNEPKGPGMFFVIPLVESFTPVDLRTLSIDVPPQEILTRDCVTVSVDAVVYYKIVKPQRAVIKVANCYSSTLLLSHTTLRTVLGTRELREILTSRDDIARQMQDILDVATDPWGVKVERVEIKDVRLPTQLQRAMAKEAESKRDAHAKLIAADGERMAAKSLCEAANIMAGSKSALQLRYLQTLSIVAQEKRSTIVFPVPVKSLGGTKKDR